MKRVAVPITNEGGPSTSKVALAPQQYQALTAIRAWEEVPASRSQVHRLFGYAGTGKTTLARELRGAGVLFAAYTGKAAQVLESKGCPAQTLHSLVMRPDNDDDSGRPQFVVNEDSDLRGSRLLVVDEVSMVGEELGEIILSFGAKVLVLGDPAQLPPIDGGGYFTRATPDTLLTEVHRQGTGSPIIEFATAIRSGERLADEQRLGTSAAYTRMGYRRALEFDQVIVGTNRTRWSWTRRLREMRGFTSSEPERGDKVICLQNNYDLGVFNGQGFTVLELGRSGLRVRDESGSERWLPAWPEAFAGTEGEARVRGMPYWEQQERAILTYGWAITCHKAQGSQWSSVLVIDESLAFRNDWRRWLYTAVTRATDHVAIIRPRDFINVRPRPRRKAVA